MPSNEHDEISGRLAELRKRGDGFRTPEPRYFEELAERSIQSGQRPAKTAGINRRWLSIAASVALLLLATVLLWPKATADTPQANNETLPASEILLADIEASDIEAYIANNLDNFETELYAVEVANLDYND